MLHSNHPENKLVWAVWKSGDLKLKKELSLSTCVVHKGAKWVISRRGKDENDCEMYKNEERSSKAYTQLLFAYNEICKLELFLSSLLLSWPTCSYTLIQHPFVWFLQQTMCSSMNLAPTLNLRTLVWHETLRWADAHIQAAEVWSDNTFSADDVFPEAEH